MNFSKKYSFVFYLIASFFALNNIFAQKEIECNIEFPNTYHSQGIKIYQAGEILYTKTDKTNISFFVKDHKREQNLYFIIVRPSDVIYKFKSSIDLIKQQTIDSMLIAPNSQYKSYKVTITKNETWSVYEQPLNEGIVPDTAVIIFYNPAYIEGCLVNNKSVTISIIKNLLEEPRTKEFLFTEELIYLFDTLHTDPLHQTSAYRVVLGNSKCKQVMHI